MKLSMFSGTAAALIASCTFGTANASDLKRVYEAPDQEVVYNNVVDWTGFYAGLLAGYGWGDQDHALSPDFTPPVSSFLSHEPKGFLFGGTVGINYQPPGTEAVVGLESDWAFANHDSRNTVPIKEGSRFFSETKVNSIGTSRIRAGFLADDNLLPYVTGGLAWASVRTEAGVEGVQAGKFLSEKDTNVGWTVGAGIEYRLDDVWSVKADYLYVDLADTEHSFNTPDDSITLKDDLTEHMVRVGVNAKLY